MAGLGGDDNNGGCHSSQFDFLPKQHFMWSFHFYALLLVGDKFLCCLTDPLCMNVVFVMVICVQLSDRHSQNILPVVASSLRSRRLHIILAHPCILAFPG